MLLTRAAIAAAVALVAIPAHAADPTAALDRTFTEYSAAGPIGNNNLHSTEFYWMFESSGSYGGQAVDSWFLIWEPTRARVRGSLTFDSPILFVQTDQAALIATAGFGKPGVVYDYSNADIGLEDLDRAGTSIAGSTLTIAWNASDPGDHVRVMTAVPEPQTHALMAAGLGMLGWLARRRRTG